MTSFHSIKTGPGSGTQVTAERYAAAPTFPAYLESVQKLRDFWGAVYRTARVGEDLQARVRGIPGTWHVLALSEDWCGDAVNALPVIARLLEANPAIDLRVLRRDENPDLMNAHLTHGTRSIPVVMVLDAGFRPRGWWGPRPGALQAWYYDEGQYLEPAERSRRKREWYARDRGATTAREVVELLEAAAAGLAEGSSRRGPGG